MHVAPLGQFCALTALHLSTRRTSPFVGALVPAEFRVLVPDELVSTSSLLGCLEERGFLACSDNLLTVGTVKAN